MKLACPFVKTIAIMGGTKALLEPLASDLSLYVIGALLTVCYFVAEGLVSIWKTAREAAAEIES